MKKIVAIIPARMASSRFFGKPLTPILGIPMIEYIRRRVALAKRIEEVYVATCDREILETIEQYGGKGVMTSAVHERCTDRVEEALTKVEADAVLIVQGDEPLIIPETLDYFIGQSLKAEDNIFCANLVVSIQNQAEWENPDIVKVVLNTQKNIMYMSRSSIPYFKTFLEVQVYKQTGISIFTKSFLHLYSQLKPTPLEKLESIDFLRILEHQYQIRGVLSSDLSIGVDRLEHVSNVERLLTTHEVQKRVHGQIKHMKQSLS